MQIALECLDPLYLFEILNCEISTLNSAAQKIPRKYSFHNFISSFVPGNNFWPTFSSKELICIIRSSNYNNLITRSRIRIIFLNKYIAANFPHNLYVVKDYNNFVIITTIFSLCSNFPFFR